MCEGNYNDMHCDMRFYIMYMCEAMVKNMRQVILNCKCGCACTHVSVLKDIFMPSKSNALMDMCECICEH